MTRQDSVRLVPDPRRVVTKLFLPRDDAYTRLIGAYFTHEYSIDAAALGNPSIVAVPDQSGVAASAVRFIMSVRAIGEGHISSIAFDGQQILPPLIETADFAEFRMTTLTGHAAQNKGIAIFPRRIDGEYVALGRQDNVNNIVMTSNDIRVRREATVIQEPKRPWELMQLGNCGSPLETEAGWLVITHGVGPMRRCTLGALLLDIDDPSQVIGDLQEPLLAPQDDERDGYVPNVVYSCGSLTHGRHLVLPYGYADVGAWVATLSVDELLNRLTGPMT